MRSLSRSVSSYIKASPRSSVNHRHSFLRNGAFIDIARDLRFFSSKIKSHEGMIPVAAENIIDCAPLYERNVVGDRTERYEKFLKEIHHAWKVNGYFYAANVTSFSSDYIAKCYTFLNELHGLPLNEKKKFVKPNGTYSGLDAGKEYAELDYEQGTVSSVRSWDYTKVVSYENYGLNYPTKNNGNISVDVQQFFTELYDRQNEFGKLLLVAVAEMLDLESDRFSTYFKDGDLGTIRLLHYPGNANPENNTKNRADSGISAHTDFEMFTLMHQDAPGLQFMRPQEDSKNNVWVDAPVSEHFVVTVGDCLERFTNGYLKATPHRVVNTSNSRNSIIRFNAVEPDTEVYPLEKFGEPKYSKTTMRQHMSTTLKNLESGLGAWDREKNQSKTANYWYA